MVSALLTSLKSQIDPDSAANQGSNSCCWRNLRDHRAPQRYRGMLRYRRTRHPFSQIAARQRQAVSADPACRLKDRNAVRQKVGPARPANECRSIETAEQDGFQSQPRQARNRRSLRCSEACAAPYSHPPLRRPQTERLLDHRHRRKALGQRIRHPQQKFGIILQYRGRERRCQLGNRYDSERWLSNRSAPGATVPGQGRCPTPSRGVCSSHRLRTASSGHDAPSAPARRTNPVAGLQQGFA